MKNFTLFPLQNNITKKIGIIIATISVIGMVLTKIGLFNNDDSKAHKIIQILNLTIIIGLFLVVFSKERYDDERVKVIRLKSLQFGFGVVLSSMISLIFVSIIHASFIFSGVHDLVLLSLFSLITYLIVFNVGLYFDFKGVYNDDTVMSNLSKNRMFVIVYTLGLLVSIILLLLI